jgi:hypothetical protein
MSWALINMRFIFMCKDDEKTREPRTLGYWSGDIDDDEYEGF